jgi:hypothetical protein
MMLMMRSEFKRMTGYTRDWPIANEGDVRTQSGKVSKKDVKKNKEERKSEEK